MGTLSRGSGRPAALRAVRVSQRGEAFDRNAFRRYTRTRRAGACCGRGFRGGGVGRLGARRRGIAKAQPKPGAAEHIRVRRVRAVARPARHAADPAGGVGLDISPRPRPPAGAGRRAHQRVRRGRLRRAGCADRVAAAAHRPRQTGRRLAAGVPAVDAAVSDADGAADETPWPAGEPAVGTHAGRRARRRRLGGDQLPDRAALARRVRDAGAAGVRRAAVRHHDGRARARRILRQGRTVAGRPDRRRDRRTRPGAAHPDLPGQRRRHGAGLSAVRAARVLRRGWRRRLVVPAPGPGVSVLENGCATTASGGFGARPAALRRAAGARPDHLLGRGISDLLPRGVRRRRRQGRVDPASGRAPLLRCLRLRGRRLVRAQPHLAGHQPQQARPHARPDLGPRPRHRPPAGGAGRRRRGELLAAGGRAVRPGLRLAGGAAARRDRRPDAGIRPARPLARLRRLGAELRADRGHVGGHRLSRRPAVQPAGARRPDRRRARRASRCWPRSSTGAAPGRAG